MLVIVGLFTPTSDNALPDEGVYLAQARALSHGSWSLERALPNARSTNYVDSIAPEVTKDSHMFPYVRHPLFPIVLTPGFALGGPTGAYLTVLSLLLVAAVAAARLAGTVNPSAEVPTLYVVSVGSPLLFSGSFVSGHTLAAAAVGGGALALVRYLESGRSRWYVLVVLAAVVCTMARSEGAVLSLIAGAVLVSIGVLQSLRLRDLHRATVAGIAIGASAALAVIVDSYWSRSITGAGQSTSALERIEAIRRSPGRAAWISLLQPWDGSAISANTFLILAGVCLVGAAAAWAVARSHPLAAAGLLTLGVVAAAMAHTTSPNLVNGLLPAFPLVLVGALSLRVRTIRAPIVSTSLAICALTIVALCFVIYDDGGANQWGGRFYHLLIPILTPVLVVACLRVIDDISPRSRRTTIAAVLVASVLISAIGLRASILFRHIHHDVRVAVEARIQPSPSDASTRSLLVVASPTNDGFSRMFWRDEPNFVTVRESMSSTFSLLLRLQRQGLASAYVLTPGDVRLLEFGGRNDLAKLGWVRLSTDRVPGTSVHLLKYGPPAHNGD